MCRPTHISKRFNRRLHSRNSPQRSRHSAQTPTDSRNFANKKKPHAPPLIFKRQNAPRVRCLRRHHRHSLFTNNHSLSISSSMFSRSLFISSNMFRHNLSINSNISSLSTNSRFISNRNRVTGKLRPPNRLTAPEARAAATGAAVNRKASLLN